MTMQKDDLKWEFFIDVMASGHCSIRDRKSRPRKGALPIFTTQTAEDAKSLLIRYCVSSRDGSGYAVPNFGGELDDLYAFGDKLRAGYAARLAELESQAEASMARVTAGGRRR